MTWCFKSLNPSTRRRAFFFSSFSLFFLRATPRAIGGSGSCMLTVGRSWLATRQTARLIPRRRVTSCFHPALFIPVLFLNISPLVPAPAGNRHPARSLLVLPFFFFFNFSPRFRLIRCLIRHLCLLAGRPCCARPRPHPLMALRVLIKSCLSLSRRGCWNPLVMGGMSRRSTGSNLANDVKCKPGEGMYVSRSPRPVLAPGSRRPVVSSSSSLLSLLLRWCWGATGRTGGLA